MPRDLSRKLHRCRARAALTWAYSLPCKHALVEQACKLPIGHGPAGSATSRIEPFRPSERVMHTPKCALAKREDMQRIMLSTGCHVKFSEVVVAPTSLLARDFAKRIRVKGRGFP